MVGDEMVGVGLRLIAGGELLASVLTHGLELSRGELGAVSLGEVDLLRGQLVADLVGDIPLGPRQQPASHRQDGRQHQSFGAYQAVERSTAHSPSRWRRDELSRGTS